MKHDLTLHSHSLCWLHLLICEVGVLPQYLLLSRRLVGRRTIAFQSIPFTHHTSSRLTLLTFICLILHPSDQHAMPSVSVSMARTRYPQVYHRETHRPSTIWRTRLEHLTSLVNWSVPWRAIILHYGPPLTFPHGLDTATRKPAYAQQRHVCYVSIAVSHRSNHCVFRERNRKWSSIKKACHSSSTLFQTQPVQAIPTRLPPWTISTQWVSCNRP